MKVSILTLFHNRRELSARFVADWRRVAPDPERLELLWGDALSTDGTAELLRSTQLPGLRTVFFEDNPGFSTGNNRLAELATGEFLVFLNNDVVLSEGWLEELLAVFEMNPRVGIAGNIQVHVDTRRVHHAGMFFDEGGTPFHYQAPLKALSRVRWFSVPAVTACCLAIPRALFATLGGFDQAYRNGCEDVDLCLRARAQGHDIVCATRSVLWHHVCSSPGRHLNDAANEALLQERFQEALSVWSKWKAPRLEGSLSASSPYLAREAVFQVYYPMANTYTEAESQHLPCRIGRWTRMQIAFSAELLASTIPLRLDPPSGGTRVQLGGASLRCARSGALLWSARGEALRTLVHAGGGATEEMGGETCFVARGDDPQLYLNLPKAVDLGLADGPLTLSLWLLVEERAIVAKDGLVGAVRRAPARGSRSLLVDLWLLRPGGENGGLRVFVLELLREFISTQSSWSVTLLVRPELAVALAEQLPQAAIIALDAVAYDSPASRTWAQLFDVLYAPVLQSRLASEALPQISVVVDLLHKERPQDFSRTACFERERWFMETLASSDAIQCNSRFVVEGLQREYGLAEASCFVVYNAVHHRLGAQCLHAGPNEEQAGREATNPYFFYPANDWPHKNHEALLQAYAMYRSRVSKPWDLVLSGHFTGLGKAEGPALGEGVKPTGYVPTASFNSLFRSASALIFPSLNEGFGIPLLEAFQLGVPVACSRCTSLPEVGGEACLYFDPSSVEEIARALEMIHYDEDRRSALKALGVDRSSCFNLTTELSHLVLRLELTHAQGRGIVQ